MQSATEFVENPRPAGGRRSGKRDFIVNVFLRQEGHLSADDLVELIRREDARISRATIYRTLQWMVDAGIARRVDFGEGRFRFEHSYRHPRHFHLICKTCNQSFEFLSSDIEALIEEVAGGAQFPPRAERAADLRHVRDVPRPGGGRAPAATAEMPCSRATRCASRLRPSAAASSSTRARRSITRDARGRKVFEQPRRRGEGAPRQARGALPRAARGRSRRSSRSRRSCSSRARPTACSPRAPRSSRRACDDRQALLIGIRCERGSHRFFKRYGERFEESEGKRIFLEFADEEREHLDLLIREYRSLVARRARSAAAGDGRRRRSA